jgi:hypothetical protein
MKTTKIQCEGQDLEVSLADGDFKEVRVLVPGGTEPELYGYDKSNGALIALCGGMIVSDEKHTAIANAVRSLLKEQ